jgi:predicted AAA+ superfamily ATPase
VHHLIEEKNIKFALSGSSARKLKTTHANLLAGRALVKNLYPLTFFEVGGVVDIAKVLRFGMLPVAFQTANPIDYLKSYADTYLKEEIKSEALTRNLGGFVRFLEIAARQNAQVTNVSNIARDAQVARQTVQGYFEILIDTLMGFWLPAWRLKSATKQVLHSKFYFFDTGICRVLTGKGIYALQPEESGHLLETYFLNEVRAYLEYSKKYYPMHYWATHDQMEVDLLLETSKGYVAFEFKASNRWEGKFNRGLKRIQSELKIPNENLMGVFMGPRELLVDDIAVFTVENFLKRLWDGTLID